LPFIITNAGTLRLEMSRAILFDPSQQIRTVLVAERHATISSAKDKNQDMFHEFTVLNRYARSVEGLSYPQTPDTAHTSIVAHGGHIGLRMLPHLASSVDLWATFEAGRSECCVWG